MTKDLVTIEPHTRVVEAMALMTETRTRRLPVIEGDKLVGLISIGDLTRWVGLPKDDLVRSLENYITGRGMTNPVVASSLERGLTN